MFDYVGVYQTFSTWSYVDSKPFQSLKFVWSFLQKSGRISVQVPPQFFTSMFFISCFIFRAKILVSS